MKTMKKVVLIFLLMCSSMVAFHQNNKATFYALPVARMQLDTTVWRFNSYAPNFMQLSGYFLNQKQLLEHKQLGLKFSVEAVPWDSTQHFAKSSNDFQSKLLCNDKVLHIGGYSINVFLFDTGKQYSIIVRLENANINADWEALMSELLAALEILLPEQMDAIAGYPLAKNTDRAALSLARKKELKEVLGTTDNMMLDNVLLNDLDLDFTFKRYTELWNKDQRMDYTNCEIVAQQRLNAGSVDLKWVSNFIDMKEMSWKIVDPDLIMDKRQMEDKDRRIRVKLYNDKDNDGALFTLLMEPIMEVHGFNIDQQGNCHESILKLDVQAYGYKYNKSIKLQAAHDGWINDEALNIKPYEKEGKTVVISETKNALVDGVIINDFANIHLMSYEVVMDAPIAFAAPAGYAKNELLLQMVNGEEDKRILEAIQLIKAKLDFSYLRYYPLKAVYLELDRRAVQNRQQNILPLKRIYRTFVMVSDFNKNGAVEYFVCYAQNGQIVFADMYEDIGDKMVHVENVNQYFDEMAQIPSIFTMLENSASPQINWGLSYDRMTRGEYLETTYDSNDVAVQEGGYDLMYSDVAMPDFPMDDSPKVNYDEQKVDESKIVYTSTQCAYPASYPGGYNTMLDFIGSKLIYPTGKRLKKPVTVTVHCIVEKNGSITVQGAECKSKQSEAYINEAKAVISKMPLWGPAILKYNKVPMSMSLDIVFDVPKKTAKN